MKIVILRDCKSPIDEYQLNLTAEGYDVEFVPLLKSEFVNENELKILLNNPCDYSGLIVTSQKVASAIQNMLQQNNQATIDPSWFLIPTYCVGPSTQTQLSLLGFTTLAGNCTGSASLLATQISNIHANSAEINPLLFLVGDKTSKTITKVLQPLGFKITTLNVYKTVNIQPKISVANTHKDCFLVLFSPSGLGSLDLDLKNGSRNVWVSIGPTTFQALKDMGVESIQAEQPTPLGILNAIKSKLAFLET